MMIDINEFLQIMLYFGLIVLIVIFIILIKKLIKTLTKVDQIIDDVNTKMDKVDGVFNIIDRTTDYASSISDKIIGAISSFVGMFFKKKKGNDEDE